MGVSLLRSWGTFARQVPYLSSVLILAVGLYVGLHGWVGLSTEAASLTPGRSGK
jgi:nickel/cobalt transporter (NicO) family protein